MLTIPAAAFVELGHVAEDEGARMRPLKHNKVLVVANGRQDHQPIRPRKLGEHLGDEVARCVRVRHGHDAHRPAVVLEAETRVIIAVHTRDDKPPGEGRLTDASKCPAYMLLSSPERDLPGMFSADACQPIVCFVVSTTTKMQVLSPTL